MGAGGGWEIDEVSDLDRVLHNTHGGEVKEGKEKSVGVGVGSNPLGTSRSRAKSKARVAKTAASRGTARVLASASSTASTEPEDVDDRRQIQEAQAQEFELVRGIKRKRELDDIGARERANDRDPRTGAWAPKPRNQDPIWIRKPLKCFPLHVRDFAGASLEIARLISRTR